jgi:hypothetical protein
LLQGADCELRRKRAIQRPANHPSRERIENDGQIYKLLLQTDEGDVRQPELIYTAELHPARQVQVLITDN